MIILGIETSCDETAAAIVKDGRTIISNVISSQVKLHSKYGGVVPELASRQHLINIIPVLREALDKATINYENIHAVAVTHGPGLAGSLIIGVNIAKALAYTLNIPLIGINHLEGHIYANWLSNEIPQFPCLCLIVSGGHSDMILMENHGKFVKIGQTRDDAAGEAFDKAAKILGLGYPGGPIIESIAKNGSPTLKLPRPLLDDSNDFSFSGLKTALLHSVLSDPNYVQNSKEDLAASFQQAVIEVLTKKTIRAAMDIGVKEIVLAGGVAANRALRDAFLINSPINVKIPPPVLCTDNAAMIASCAYYHINEGIISKLDLDVQPNLSFN